MRTKINWVEVHTDELDLVVYTIIGVVLGKESKDKFQLEIRREQPVGSGFEFHVWFLGTPRAAAISHLFGQVTAFYELLTVIGIDESDQWSTALRTVGLTND